MKNVVIITGKRATGKSLLATTLSNGISSSCCSVKCNGIDDIMKVKNIAESDYIIIECAIPVQELQQIKDVAIINCINSGYE